MDIAEKWRDGLHWQPKNYDLIILDIMLPLLSGIKFFFIKRKGKYYSVIFLTAKDSEGSIVNGLNLGRTIISLSPFLS